MSGRKLSRRDFLTRTAAGVAVACSDLFIPGVFAEELTRTPSQSEGPFYPDKLPLDVDNDLVIVNNSTTPAVGEITHLSGRILDSRGEPVRNAQIEIWQVDNNGCYIHSQARAGASVTATFRDSAASLRARPANTASARSSRWSTQAVRRIFTLR